MQRHIVQEWRTGVELHVQAVVQVVIEVGAGGDDPIDEAGLHQRDETRFAQAGRRERAGEAQADEAVAREHFVGQEFGGLAETAAVVSEEGAVDQIGGGNIFAHAGGIETGIGEQLVGRACRIEHGRIVRK